MSADKIKTRLESFGLTCKDLKYLKHGSLVLGLRVWWGAQHLVLEMRDCDSRTPCWDDVTHHISHLWQACRTLSPFLGDSKGDWNNKVTNIDKETKWPSWWCPSQPGCDRSVEWSVFWWSLWFHLANDAQHINLVELDATLKGINLVLQWQSIIVHLHIDSNKAASKILVWRSSWSNSTTCKSMSLWLHWKKNLADWLTWVLKRRLDMMKWGSDPSPLACAVLADQLTAEQVCSAYNLFLSKNMSLHHKSCSQISNTSLWRMSNNWPSSSLVENGKDQSGWQLVLIGHGYNTLPWQWISKVDQMWADVFYYAAPSDAPGCINHYARTEIYFVWMWFTCWNTNG